MSRLIIQDIIMPIVEKILSEQGYHASYGHLTIRDPQLEEFLEEEMRRHFGVIGANECQHLKEQLEEAKKNDPYAFEFLIRRLLEKYIKLAARTRIAKRLKEFEGPPDKFSELRRKYNQSRVEDEAYAL